MKGKFQIGDKLKSNEFDSKEYGIQSVTITSINEKNQVYHWESPYPLLGGMIHSGYFFNEAELYEE